MKPFRPPVAQATRLLIVACVAVHLGMTLVGPRAAERVILGWGLVPARLTLGLHGLRGAAPAWATPVTSLFLHGGWAHLLLNLVLLSWVGRQVEWVIRPARLMGLFLVGGIMGGLAQVAFDPRSIAPVVGASGGISAVLAAYVVLFARNEVAERRVLGLRVPPAIVTGVWYASAWIGVQLLTAVALNTGPGFRIAIWTHIGGFLTGLLAAQFWGRRAPRVSPR